MACALARLSPVSMTVVMPSARNSCMACRELGLTWRQYNDGMGWANRFVRQWGVRAVPCVFVVDRRGRLAGSSGAAGWRKLALSMREN